MAPATQPAPSQRPPARPNGPARPTAQDDGTNQLLKSGGWTLGAGVFFALLTKFALGGIGDQGPHTNGGWMALIVTMMCLPFGFLLSLLGVLKWLRKRRER